MNKLFTFMLTISSFHMYAGTFSDLNWEDLIKGRAEISLSKFNLKLFDKTRLQTELQKSHSKASCGDANIGNASLNELSSDWDEPKIAAELKKIESEIIYSVSAQDGSEGYREYCSTATFKFYSKDGEVLQIYFDYNS